jgi:hypothetical protein
VFVADADALADEFGAIVDQAPDGFDVEAFQAGLGGPEHGRP